VTIVALVSVATSTLFAADTAAILAGNGDSGILEWLLIAGAAVVGIAAGWLIGQKGARMRRLSEFKVALLRFSPNGNIVEWNSAAEALARASGLPDPQSLAPDNAMELISQCLSETGSAAATHEWSAGDRWFSGTFEPLERGGGVQVLLSDITESHHLGEEITRVREESESNTRMTSEFVSNISHDIRVPMSGVIGLGKLLLETDLNPEQQELSRTLVESAESVVTLADELLDLAKIEAGKLEVEVRPMELSSLVEDTLRSQSARAAEKRIDLFSEVGSDLPGMIHADPVRVRQVLANLISNGLKFTSRGEIAVTVKQVGTDDGAAELQFAVRDTGIGIPEEKRDRLFKAFNQADSTTYKMHGGTGLGLVTSRQLAELMGGRLWFESEPNRGSTFFFTLPLKPVANAVPPSWTLEQPKLKGRTAVVVEDNPRLLTLIDGLMTRWGMKVATFRTTMEVLTWLENNPPPQIVLVDLDVPELAAFPLIHHLAGLPGRPPRLLGMAFEPQTRAKSSVEFELLLKPVCPSNLLDHLRRPPRPVGAIGGNDGPGADPSMGAPAGRTAPSVLVADDDPVNRRVVRNFLERLGCIVTTVSDGSEALTCYEANRFDIVFLDLMMPGMDGFGVTRTIREQEAAAPANSPKRRQPIVALTAKAMAGDAEASLAGGFDAHLTKPVSEQSFRETLERFAGHLPSRPPLPRLPRLSTLQAPGEGVVDRARLDELGSGNPTVVADIARMYFERITHLAPEISAALVSARAEDAKRHAHTGAGSSSTAGMIAAAKAFRTLEEAIGRGDLASGDKLLADALEAVERCRRAMQPVLRETPATTKDSTR